MKSEINNHVSEPADPGEIIAVSEMRYCAGNDFSCPVCFGIEPLMRGCFFCGGTGRVGITGKMEGDFDDQPSRS